MSASSNAEDLASSRQRSGRGVSSSTATGHLPWPPPPRRQTRAQPGRRAGVRRRSRQAHRRSGQAARLPPLLPTVSFPRFHLPPSLPLSSFSLSSPSLHFFSLFLPPSLASFPLFFLSLFFLSPFLPPSGAARCPGAGHLKRLWQPGRAGADGSAQPRVRGRPGTCGPAAGKRAGPPREAPPPPPPPALEAAGAARPLPVPGPWREGGAVLQKSSGPPPSFPRSLSAVVEPAARGRSGVLTAAHVLRREVGGPPATGFQRPRAAARLLGELSERAVPGLALARGGGSAAEGGLALEALRAFPVEAAELGGREPDTALLASPGGWAAC